MKKKILAILLCAVMVMGILPVYAFAEVGPGPIGEYSPIISIGTIADGFDCIGTVYLCDTAYNDAVQGITYDTATNTLILDNYVNEKACFEIDSMGDDFKIEIIGVCKVQRINVGCNNWGGSLTIIGDGTLEINRNRVSYVAIGLDAWGWNTSSILTFGKDVKVYMYAHEEEAGMSSPRVISLNSEKTDNVGDLIINSNGQPLSGDISVTINAYGDYDVEIDCNEYFYEGNFAQEPTGASLVDLTETYADIMERTVTDNMKFLQQTRMIRQYDKDKDTYIVKQLNLGELARAVAWFNYCGYVPDGNLADYLNALIDKNLITFSQSEFILKRVETIKTNAFTWMYKIVSEEDKTAEISALLVINANITSADYDIIMPEMIDGYTIIGIADGASEKRTGLFQPHSIFIPDTYRRIGQSFSYGNEQLRYIRLPENLEYIGFGSFDGCWQLQYSQNYGYEQCVEYDAHFVKYVGEYCFGGGDYVQYLPDPYTIAIRPGTTLIKGQAFNNLDEEIRMIIIPEGVKNICQGAFIMCDGLRSIVLPSTVTEIGYQTFMAAGINAIYIPPTVTKIDPEGIGGISRGLDTYEHLADLTVYGVSGSAAEEYANLYDDVYFVDINDMVYGDIDSDGIVTLNDYSTAKTVVVDDTVRLDGNAEILGDMNADRAIDAFDLFAIDKTVNNIS